ncbi:hypothetical protein [Neorhizobium tomejilense]|nr:hypothetical protein [Neorhizobium tomejilense]
MQLGRIVEIGPGAEVFGNPRHAYTQALLSAVPNPIRKRSGRRQCRWRSCHRRFTRSDSPCRSRNTGTLAPGIASL